MTTLKDLVAEHPIVTGAAGFTVLGVLSAVAFWVVNHFENRKYKRTIEAEVQHIMEDQPNRR